MPRLEKLFDMSHGLWLEKNVTADGADFGGNMVDNNDLAILSHGVGDEALFVRAGAPID
jgi:hypothetical protein